MVSATMMIVIITVILGGGLTTPMLGWLQIRSDLELIIELIYWDHQGNSRWGGGGGGLTIPMLGWLQIRSDLEFM